MSLQSQHTQRPSFLHLFTYKSIRKICRNLESQNMFKHYRNTFHTRNTILKLWGANVLRNVPFKVIRWSLYSFYGGRKWWIKWMYKTGGNGWAYTYQDLMTRVRRITPPWTMTGMISPARVVFGGRAMPGWTPRLSWFTSATVGCGGISALWLWWCKRKARRWHHVKNKNLSCCREPNLFTLKLRRRVSWVH